MKAFTDYPIIEIGDTPNEIALIREVEILSYDGNKYCLVFVQGVLTTIKSGYLYWEFGRTGETLCLMHDDLKKLPLTKDMTLLDLADKDELKKKAKAFQKALNLMRDERHRDYVRLRTKYEAAERNLKNNPKECGGEEHIKGYMSGLIEAMALLGDLQSKVCGKGEEVAKEED